MTTGRHTSLMGKAKIGALAAGMLAGLASAVAGESSSVGQAAHDYIAIAKEYAETMIREGRDRYGETHSPIFTSALDRETHRMFEPGRLPCDTSVGHLRIIHVKRPSSGSNPQDHGPLYVLLYRLSEYTGDPHYAEAADDAIRWFFENTRSAKTDLLAWGEHMYWCPHRDRAGTSRGWYHEALHTSDGSFTSWDEVLRAAPEALGAYARGVWKHQIYDHETGDFGRHTDYRRHSPERLGGILRHAAYYMEIWAWEYKRSRDPEMLEALGVMREYMERLRHPDGSVPPNNFDTSEAARAKYRPYLTRVRTDYTATLELQTSVYLYNAARLISSYDSELAGRLRESVRQTDEAFLSLPHEIASRGFIVSLDQHDDIDTAHYAEQWPGRTPHRHNAAIASRCHQLSLLTPDEEHRQRFEKLVVEAADTYLESAPDPSDLIHPSAFWGGIRLMLNAHALTGESKYLERADYFGRLAVDMFFDSASPLPKVTNKHDWYEAYTGGPALVESMFELGVAMQAAGL